MLVNIIGMIVVGIVFSTVSLSACLSLLFVHCLNIS